MKKGLKLLFALIIILLLLGVGYLFYLNITTAPYITSIEKNESKRYNDKIIINVHVENYFYKLSKETWCFVTEDNDSPDVDDPNWVMSSNGYCNFTVPAGEYEIFVKDIIGNINSIDTQEVKIDKVVQIKPDKEIFYLYKGQKD